MASPPDAIAHFTSYPWAEVAATGPSTLGQEKQKWPFG